MAATPFIETPMGSSSSTSDEIDAYYARYANPKILVTEPPLKETDIRKLNLMELLALFEHLNAAILTSIQPSAGLTSKEFTLFSVRSKILKRHISVAFRNMQGELENALKEHQQQLSRIYKYFQEHPKEYYSAFWWQFKKIEYQVKSQRHTGEIAEKNYKLYEDYSNMLAADRRLKFSPMASEQYQLKSETIPNIQQILDMIKNLK